MLPIPIFFSELVCLDQKNNLFWVLAWHCIQWNRSSDRSLILYCDEQLNIMDYGKKECRAGTCFYVVSWLDFEITDVYGLRLSGLNVWRSPIYCISPERSLTFSPDDGVFTFWSNKVKQAKK